MGLKREHERKQDQAIEKQLSERGGEFKNESEGWIGQVCER